MASSSQRIKKVLIMLSTYNGEKFLARQLDSLYNQVGVDVHILVRDDGSKDSTLSILNDYVANKSCMTILAGQNVGPAMSFYMLMKEAWEHHSDYDYYAFSDQDDEWDTNKMSSAVEKLDESDNPYKLYYCKFRVINGCGDVIEQNSISVQQPDYKNCLFRNPAPGCSQVFSIGLLERSVDIFGFINSPKFNKAYLHLHDVWTIHLACYLNAFIYADNSPLFSYRQHSANVTIYSENSYIKRYKTVKKDLERIPNKYSHAAYLLLDMEGQYIDPEKKSFLRKVINYQDNFLKTIFFALTYPTVHKQMYVRLYAFYAIIKRLF